MGKKGKYEGGSVPVTFRLPAKDLEKAKAGVENYLRRFEAGYDETFGSFIDGILSVYEEKGGVEAKNSVSGSGIVLAKDASAVSTRIDSEDGLLVFKTNGEDRTPGKGIDPLAFETLALDPKIWEAEPEEKVKEMLKKRAEKKIDAPRLITYDCGCVDDGIFYRRDPSCRLDRDQHKRVVIKNQ